MSDRKPLDAYFTPRPLAKAIVNRVSCLISPPTRILEPAAGGGSFVQACVETWRAARVAAVDLDPTCRESCLAAGASGFAAADARTLTVPPVDLIIGNPPFSDAEAIIVNLLKASGGTPLAFLLRVGFLAGPRCKPGRLFEKHPVSYLAPIFPRPSFTADGRTDASEYALFVFGAVLETGVGSPITWERP